MRGFKIPFLQPSQEQIIVAEDTFEKPVEAVLLVLAILAGGGFLGLRLYESQSLSQAKSDLQQGSWRTRWI